MAAADVGQQLGQEVAAAVAVRRVPQMMVRIDDRQVGLQRRLRRAAWPARPRDRHCCRWISPRYSPCGHACFLLAWRQAYGRSGERSMRICVYGAGAIGGNFAARLADAGNEVSIVARGAHLEAIRARGLTLLAGDKKIVAKVKASDRPADLGPQDAVLVTMKASGQHALADSIGPLLRRRHAGRLRAERHSLVVRPRASPSRARRRPICRGSTRAARSPRRSACTAWWAPSSARRTTSSSPAWCENEVPDRNILWVGETGRPPQPAHRGAASRAEGGRHRLARDAPTSATRSGTS